jgi:hypothetical protein
MDWTLKTLIPEHFSFYTVSNYVKWLEENKQIILEPAKVYSFYIDEVEYGFAVIGDGVTHLINLPKYTKNKYNQQIMEVEYDTTRITKPQN